MLREQGVLWARCSVICLGASRPAKAVYTTRLKRSLAYSTGLVPPNGASDRRACDILMISAMLERSTSLVPCRTQTFHQRFSNRRGIS